jgi:creatinine amidohydrolase/Fe(II)-dependent formamide hydrolase-like protein
MPDTVHADPLTALKVIDRLEIGPVELERRWMVAPYTVHQGGSIDTFAFTYRFKEEVFEPQDWASQNLAALMAAQPALNYGLFANEIVLRGPLDNVDRRFLAEMAENTAREIYVNKLLAPNPFLKDGFNRPPAEKLPAYLQAQLLFPDPADRTSRPRSVNPVETAAAEFDAEAEHLPAGDPADGLAGGPRAGSRRVAVLSSGGKESLLSYALLRDLGCRIESVFINESGKHWFTALNAYRDFAQHVPGTRRVWTNSDRLFAWMLRHLPFIREDFARLRADDYPIRLWTVAVFLFGALPLLRKQNIGSLVIGDEFDTTVRASRGGITHYDGLYDQSRYFDQALTRFYRRKGWPLCQFSILRPVSELLVQKVLVERYPDLQRLQVSCHAAHSERTSAAAAGAGSHISPATGTDRHSVVRPCGRCEKCTRVVGMLMALGADPQHCGYTDEQIKFCLENLARKGIHQEQPAQEHAAWLLHERGLLPAPPGGTLQPRRHPEVLKLRFDPERSPFEDIPTDLRQPLYRILLEHAEGAVRRTGRMWVDFDPLSDPAIVAPYPFETRPGQANGDGSKAESSATAAVRPWILGELTWPEAKKRFRETDVALLPVGAVEQHGHHLPLDTDAYDADCLCRSVAERCRDPRPLVLPLIPYGVSYHHDDFAGTISIGPETLSRLVYEIGTSVARHGITKLVIVNAHGGNAAALHFAAQLINRDAHIFTCVDSGETSDADVAALAETPSDVHAGEIETSTSLANRPGLVRMSKARRWVPQFSSHYLDFSSKRSVEWYARTAKLSPSGVLGDATRATREKGEQMWSLMIEHLVSFVEDLSSLTLDEIHQKAKY